MLFEKTIRKKRISPFYLEVVGIALYWQFLILITLIVFTWISWQFWGRYLIIVDIFCFSLSLLLVPFIQIPSLFYARKLKRDIKNNNFVIKDSLVIGYDYQYATVSWGDIGFIETFLHLFYTEPCLRLCVFEILPEKKETLPVEALKFFLQEVHFTYRWQDDYRKYRKEYDQIQDNHKKGSLKENITKKMSTKENDSSKILLYLTYAKMQVLNKLFELVDPPEFRITTYEESGVFISIEPIPGKEYPSEALECMEKINAIYP